MPLTIIPRAFDDLLLDIMVAQARAVSTAQVAIGGPVFYSDRDYMRPVVASKMPFANFYVESTQPDPTKSSPLTECYETVTINADLIVRGVRNEAATGSDPKSGDQVAVRSLLYIREQIKDAIYNLANALFGLVPCPIARKSWPRWTQNPERWLNMETQIADGQLSFTVEHVWEPRNDQATVALTDLYATLTNTTHSPQPGVHEHYA